MVRDKDYENKSDLKIIKSDKSMDGLKKMENAVAWHKKTDLHKVYNLQNLHKQETLPLSFILLYGLYATTYGLCLCLLQEVKMHQETHFEH